MEHHPYRVTGAVSVLSCIPLCSAATQNPTPPEQLTWSAPESSNVPHAEILRSVTSVCMCWQACVREQERVLAQEWKERSLSSGWNICIQRGGLSSRNLTDCNKICATDSSWFKNLDLCWNAVYSVKKAHPSPTLLLLTSHLITAYFT